MKQARKMKLPTPVTLGLVEAVAIMGILAAWQMGAPANETLDMTVPTMAQALSCSMSFV